MTSQDISQNGRGQAAEHPAPIISKQTRITAIAMTLIAVILFVADYLSAMGTITWAGDLVAAALMFAPVPIAIVMLMVARGFDGPTRRQWSFLSYGMLSVGAGGAIWVILYLVTGKDPYPSFADFFTLLGYVLFGVAFYFAIVAYRGLLDIRRPLLIGAGLAAIAMAIVYFTVIGPYVIFAPTEAQSMLTRIFNTIYPILDVFVLLMPAITLGLLVSKLGAGRIAWPWWLVVAGAGTLAITDAVFAYNGYVGAGRTPIVDSGYALAPLLIGIAILVARDVYHS